MGSEQKSPKTNEKAPKLLVGRWLRRAMLIGVVLPIIALITFALLPEPLPVDLARVTLGPLQVEVEEDGIARIKDRYVVSATLSGSVARIQLNPGDAIKQGEILARIVPIAPPLLDERSRKSAEVRVAATLAAQRQIRAQLEGAKAELVFARRELDRQRQLNAAGTTARAILDQAELSERRSRAELESLQFGARVADHEVEMARTVLERLSPRGARNEEQLEIPSPVRGKVLRVIQRSEGVVQAGAPLLELGDPHTLEIVVDVLTSDAVDIRPGARVLLDRWGGPTLEAQVRTIEPSAFTRVSALGVDEQRVNVVIDIRSKRETWASLGDGYRVEAHVVVWQASNIIRVPSSAIFRHRQGWAVFRVDEGIAHLRPIEVGKRTPEIVQVTHGLEPGARVVVHPSDRIRHGVKVVAR